MAGEPLHIIGAGPVGSLLALMLARRGHDIELYERRPDLRREVISAGRSINLAVSARGLHALAQVGLERAVLERSVPMASRAAHALDGEVRLLPYGERDQCIHSVSRGAINALLLDAAERAHEQGGGRVRLHVRTRLLSYDLERQQGRLRDEVSGEERSVSMPICFGCDGSASALRSAIAREGAGQCEEELLDFGYKELALPAAAGAGVGPGGRFAFAPNALHIWPRGSFMLIALPNQDGSFTCTLFLPFEAAPGAPSFAALADGQGVRDFFQQTFPDVAALLPDLEQQFAAAPLGQMVTVRTSPWSRGGALLLGDAAHAIVPFFGQGMNAGFEDCTLLEALLREHGDAMLAEASWAELAARFAQARKPDADAIAALALENFVEMRDRVADPRFLLERAVEAQMQQRLGSGYRTRYQLVTFSRTPYRHAREIGKLQARIIGAACDGKSALEAVDLEFVERELRRALLPMLQALESSGVPNGSRNQG